VRAEDISDDAGAAVNLSHPYETIIEALAEQALEEIKQLSRQAREATDRSFAFLNRSRGQRRRFERQRQLNGRNQ
jgi:hypothetical protein